MTDLPDTDTLKWMLAQATPGPWKAVLGEDQPWPAYIGLVGYVSMNPLISVVCDHNCEADHWPTNANLIALAPTLAARVIELEAEVANLRAAIHEASHPDFLWGALDNVHDAEATLDDYAAAASRAIRAALGADE